MLSTVTEQRRVAVLTHTGRPEAVVAAGRLVQGLTAAGIECMLPPNDVTELGNELGGARVTPLSEADHDVDGCELAIVLGGDGTILRAAELVRDGSAPILGINMGHVGFLAEIERDDMDDAVRRVIARMGDDAMRRLVLDAAERLVREEIDRIKRTSVPAGPRPEA